jgi:hypothetical protein
MAKLSLTWTHGKLGFSVSSDSLSFFHDPKVAVSFLFLTLLAKYTKTGSLLQIRGASSSKLEGYLLTVAGMVAQYQGIWPCSPGRESPTRVFGLYHSSGTLDSQRDLMVVVSGRTRDMVPRPWGEFITQRMNPSGTSP